MLLCESLEMPDGKNTMDYLIENDICQEIQTSEAICQSAVRDNVDEEVVPEEEQVEAISKILDWETISRPSNSWERDLRSDEPENSDCDIFTLVDKIPQLCDNSTRTILHETSALTQQTLQKDDSSTSKLFNKEANRLTLTSSDKNEKQLPSIWQNVAEIKEFVPRYSHSCLKQEQLCGQTAYKSEGDVSTSEKTVAENSLKLELEQQLTAAYFESSGREMLNDPSEEYFKEWNAKKNVEDQRRSLSLSPKVGDVFAVEGERHLRYLERVELCSHPQLSGLQPLNWENYLGKGKLIKKDYESKHGSGKSNRIYPFQSKWGIPGIEDNTLKSTLEELPIESFEVLYSTDFIEDLSEINDCETTTLIQPEGKEYNDTCEKSEEGCMKLGSETFCLNADADVFIASLATTTHLAGEVGESYNATGIWENPSETNKNLEEELGEYDKEVKNDISERTEEAAGEEIKSERSTSRADLEVDVTTAELSPTFFQRDAANTLTGLHPKENLTKTNNSMAEGLGCCEGVVQSDINKEMEEVTRETPNSESAEATNFSSTKSNLMAVYKDIVSTIDSSDRTCSGKIDTPAEGKDFLCAESDNAREGSVRAKNPTRYLSQAAPSEGTSEPKPRKYYESALGGVSGDSRESAVVGDISGTRRGPRWGRTPKTYQLYPDQRAPVNPPDNANEILVSCVFFIIVCGICFFTLIVVYLGLK